MLTTLLVLTLSAQGSWCENIRAVRRLAQRDALDDATLATLERRYCVAMPDHTSAEPQTFTFSPPSLKAEAPAGPVNPDCADLWTMAVLARAGRASSAVLETIDAQVQVSCSHGARELNALQWPGGAWAKSGDVWWYPNGRAARQKEVWWYPNGRVARNGALLYYPTGRVAKNGETWFDPESGKPMSAEAILSWYCAGHTSLCNPRLAAMRGLPEEVKEAGYLELLWSAR